MTPGSCRAPPLLAPFIKKSSCWFSSGSSQRALAQRRARGQRGFGDGRREVCSLPGAFFFRASSTTYFQWCVTPESSACLKNQHGQTEQGKSSSLKASQRQQQKITLNNALSHFSETPDRASNTVSIMNHVPSETPWMLLQRLCFSGAMSGTSQARR